MDLRTRRPFLLETLSVGGIDLEVNNKPQPRMNNFSGSELLQKSLCIYHQCHAARLNHFIEDRIG